MASAEVVITARHVVVHGGEQRGARGVGIELAGLYQRPKIVVGQGNVVRRDAKKVANESKKTRFDSIYKPLIRPFLRF